MHIRFAAIAALSFVCLVSSSGDRAFAEAPYVEYEAACKADLEDNGQAEVICACMVRNLQGKEIAEADIAAFLEARDGATPSQEMQALADFEAQLANACTGNPDTVLTKE